MNKLSLTLRIFISYFILIATAATAILWFTVVQIEDAVTETAQQEFEEDYYNVIDTISSFYEETYGPEEEIDREGETALPALPIDAVQENVEPPSEEAVEEENPIIENIDEESGDGEVDDEENTDDEAEEEIDGEENIDEEENDDEIDDEELDDEELEDEENIDDETIDDEIDDEGLDNEEEPIEEEEEEIEDEVIDEEAGDEENLDEAVDDGEEENEEGIDETAPEDANLGGRIATQPRPARQASLAPQMGLDTAVLLQHNRTILSASVTQQQVVDAEMESQNYQNMIRTLQEQANFLDLHIRLLSPDGTIAYYDSATQQENVPIALSREVIFVIEENEAWIDPSATGDTIIGAEFLYWVDEPAAIVWVEAPWEAVVATAQTQQWGLIGGTGVVGLILLVVLGGGLARVVTQPLTELRETAQQMAKGNLDARASTNAPSEVRMLAEDFNSMATAVERMMAEQRAFASNAAHELRTPLTAIRLRTETLLEDDPDEELQERYISEIQLETERLGRLVDDLRVLSQADSQRLQIGQEQVDLSQIIPILEREFSRHITEKSLDFTTHIGEGPFVMQGSTAHIRTIMRNIVENSVKYTPENGRVKLNLYRVADRIVVDIQDNGIGIPKEDLPQLFKRFYRVDKAHSRTIPGSGLGLSLVQSIVTLYNGKIKIESDGIDMGTTVRIALPIAQQKDTTDNSSSS